MKKITYINLLILPLFGLAFLMLSPKAFAATHTWSGTDCFNTSQPSPNCNFSDSANWSPATVPATGDDLVFDNSSFTQYRTLIFDDITSTISGNSLVPAVVHGNITFQGSSLNDVTIEPVDSSSGNIAGFYMNGDLTNNIVSGSNPMVSGIYGNFINEKASPTYAINDGFFLGYVGSDAPFASFLGSGTVNITGNSSNTDFQNNTQILSTSSYGTTNEIDLNLSSDGDMQQLNNTTSLFAGILKINSGSFIYAPIQSPLVLVDPFSAGASIQVASGASFIVSDASAITTTFSEPLTIAGSGSTNCSDNGAAAACGAIFANIDPTGTLTFSGNSSLSATAQVNTNAKVAFSGTMNLNSHVLTAPYVGTVTYLVGASTVTLTGTSPVLSPPDATGVSGTGGTGTGTGTGGTGGAGTGGSGSTVAPKTPNTGSTLESSRPVLILISTTLLSGSLLILAKVNKTKTSRR